MKDVFPYIRRLMCGINDVIIRQFLPSLAQVSQKQRLHGKPFIFHLLRIY